jgi:cell wall-associated protease
MFTIFRTYLLIEIRKCRWMGMREWKKRLAVVGLSSSLLAGMVFTPVSAQLNNSVNIYNKAAVGLNQTWMLQKNNNVSESPFSEDTLIIRYKAPISVAEHKRLGATLIKQISDLHYAVVKVQDKKKLKTVISNYQNSHSVISVNQSVIYKSYGLEDPKTTEQYQLQLLQMEKAQKLVPNKKIKVAVIDTGIDMNHPELTGQLLPSYNMVNPMNPGTPDAHGTHVAGIIAGKKNNGLGGYGINPNAQIIPIDVFDRMGGASDYSIAQGILQAIKSGAKVINLSLGAPAPSTLIEDAVKRALANNIVVVAAAGNSGNDWTNYPAGYEGVISVGNVDSREKLAVSSSYGTSIDVVAPGEQIYSTIYGAEKLSSFRKLSGTSMASPIVAGVASLLLTKYPHLTPSQVEYILEHSAKDLGTKGYDVKYGNGIIDPVKALQFDMKKLPKIAGKTLTKKEILEMAKPITLPLDTPVGETGTITKPFEEKWVKFDVQEGEYIQAILEAGNLFDYKMKIHFYSEGKDLTEEINEVREGKSEAKLFKAPFTGTVAIGMKDVNGSYDDSSAKQSKYSLYLKRISELPSDKSSVEAPTAMENLPFNSEETFIGEEGDEDYFTFSVTEKQVIKVEAGGVPGVNSHISVYTEDMLSQLRGEVTTEEGKAETAHDVKPEEQIPPMFFANAKGKSEGEVLTFTAEPGLKYAVKFSNKPTSIYGSYDMYMGYGSDVSAKAEPSIIPYNIKVIGKVLPKDEDNYPMMDDIPMEEGQELNQETIADKLNSYQSAHDPWMDEYLSRIESSARPYGIGESADGYLQYLGDEDWFQLTPSKTGIYEFGLTPAGDVPILEVYQLVTQKDELGNEYTFFNVIGSNIQYGWSSVAIGQKAYTGLKAHETYYIKASTNWMNNQISLNQYMFNSKLFIDNPQDKYENNDELEKVKNLPGMIFEGNFAMPNDQDAFYFQATSNQVYGVKLENGSLNSQLRKYPKEIVSPFYGQMLIYEDTNKNRKVDGNENRTIQFVNRSSNLGNTHGSFLTEKGKNYIISISGYTESYVPLTLLPYKVTIGKINTKDEDAASKVINGKPSKPITFKKVNPNLWEQTGYFNSEIGYGDEDWFVFTLDRNRSGVIKLESPLEIDGQIEIYRDGKRINSADFYPEGDAEVLSTSLKKGTYYIKVSSKFGYTSLSSYKLKVYMK